ncbi:50S ribosomal protein L18 [Candidatus Spongiihabitans sp.]|uniref:50S ribosomal protein L18 n=1 Tax=Candidatus Spongiihabitans sp. TaxID=3101308 RepID=UPI003C6F026C
MVNKNSARLRRARKIRGKIARLGAIRLSVHRTPRHFYAQIFDPSGEKVLVSASTLDAALRKKLKNSGNRDAAIAVGEMLAKNALSAGIERVAFDRSGYLYHGRLQAFADAAREHGLKF